MRPSEANRRHSPHSPLLPFSAILHGNFIHTSVRRHIELDQTPKKGRGVPEIGCPMGWGYISCCFIATAEVCTKCDSYQTYGISRDVDLA